MDKVHIGGRMAVATKECTKMIKSMGLVYIVGQTAVNIREIGKMVSSMV